MKEGMKMANDNQKYSAIKLREAIYQSNLTIAEISKRTSVSMASISQYLSGRCAPNNINAGKLATVLNVNPLELMGFDLSEYQKIDIDDELTNHIIREIQGLSDADKKHILNYIKFYKTQKGDE